MSTLPIKADFPEKLQFLFEPHRYKVSYGGRGGAKSWGYARALLILGAQKPLRVLCARETQTSIKESVHHLLSDQIESLGLGGFYHVLANRIDGANGTEIVFAGLREALHNLKSYEGIDICWVEEAHVVTHQSWEALIPTIRKEGSEIWVSFNPHLETDDAYQRFVVKPYPPEMQATTFINWQDNPWVNDVMRREMEALRAKDEAEYMHVYEGLCQIATKGAVYKSEIMAAEVGGRITRVPYDPINPVYTFWDLGFGDRTSIWFAQSIGFEFHVIDFFEGCQQALAYYLKALQEKPYVYAIHHLPHDAQAHELGSGRSIQEQMVTAFGREKVKIVKKLSVSDGIAAARALFNRCWFDRERCADGLQALRHYRYERDDKLLEFKREPLHDWSSHAADAFRYLAVAIEEVRMKPQLPRQPQPRYGVWS